MPAAVKLCSKCKCLLSISCFYSRGNICKPCVLLRQKKYYLEKAEKIKAYQKEYNEKNSAKILANRRNYRKKHKIKIKNYMLEYNKNNKDELKDKQKHYRENNKDLIRAAKKSYYSKNKDKILEKDKAYYAKNKDAIIKQKVAYEREKLKEDYRFKIIKSLRTHCRRLLHKHFNSNIMLEFLGCTVEEFKTHIESQWLSGMTWDNWTFDGWHLDHIIPLASIKSADDTDQIKKVCHYTNLRPLWAKDNLRKGARAL